MQQPVLCLTGEIYGQNERYLDMYLGENSYIVGDLKELGGQQVAIINHFKVSRLLRGNGIGEKLFKSFVAEAVARGATSLWSESVSNMALGVRAKVLGATAMTFYDSSAPEQGFLPITYAQARATNERVLEAWLNGTENDDKPDNLGVYVDLTQIDVHDWPRPCSNDEQDLVAN
jgi:predicted GNAT family acetyltransferase